MIESSIRIYKELLERYPSISSLEDKILKAYYLIEETYKNNGKILLCGNGGSAADSEHMVGELLR